MSTLERLGNGAFGAANLVLTVFAAAPLVHGAAVGLGNIGTRAIGGIRGAFAAEEAAAVTSSIASEPNRIYSARELIRRAEDTGPFHNFPESFNAQIFKGNRRVISDNYVLYTMRGAINGKTGVFEIGVRPSASGRTEVIVHRFFKPDP